MHPGLTNTNLSEILHHNIGARLLQRFAVAAPVDSDHTTEATGAAGRHPGDSVLDHHGDAAGSTPNRDAASRKIAGSGLPGRPRRADLVAVHHRVEDRRIDTGRPQDRRRVPARGDQGYAQCRRPGAGRSDPASTDRARPHPRPAPRGTSRSSCCRRRTPSSPRAGRPVSPRAARSPATSGSPGHRRISACRRHGSDSRSPRRTEEHPTRSRRGRSRTSPSRPGDGPGPSR